MMIIMIFSFGILMGSFGAILMKLGANSIGPFEIHSLTDLTRYLFELFTNLRSISGIGLYFLSAITWSYLLTKLDISFVQPILALTYVITPILAIFILGEHVSVTRWAGILVVIAGVFLIAKSAAL